MAKVLLIDDDTDLVNMNKAVLENLGHEIHVAYSAAEGRRQVNNIQPDILVVDVMMETDSAGFDLVREIHQARPEMPIIMLTGIRAARELPFTFEPETWLPVTTFMEKPVDPKDLAVKIENILKG